MVVAANGVLYVNTWSGRYYGNDIPHAGGFLVALQDKNGAGRANVIERFGETVQTGGDGGTGIGTYKGAIYAEINDRIVRYSLSANSIVSSGHGETIVSGLPLSGDHPMHPFIISVNGTMYVDVATPTNSCQVRNRMLESPGLNPARSSTPVAVSGATMRIRRIKRFPQPSAMLREFATRKGLPLNRTGKYL
jgi:hypothetical protein